MSSKKVCFVPLCPTGRRSNKKQNLHLFSAPKDPLILDHWNLQFRKFGIKNVFHENNDSICIKHFQARYISKVDSSGDRVVASDKSSLTDDAIPTIFDVADTNESESDDGIEINEGAEDVDKDLVESSASSESEEEVSNGSKTNDGTEPPGTNSDSDSEPLEELPIARTRGTRGRPRKLPESVDEVSPVPKKKAATATKNATRVSTRLLNNAVSSPLRMPRITIANKSIFEVDDEQELEESSEDILTRKGLTTRFVKPSTRSYSLKSNERTEPNNALTLVESEIQTSSLVGSTGSRTSLANNSVRRNTGNTGYKGRKIPAFDRTNSSQQSGVSTNPEFLEISDIGYNLEYILEIKNKIVLPASWIIQSVEDSDDSVRSVSKKVICIGELNFHEEKVTLRRVIKIYQNMTYKIDVNGIDFTPMFEQLGTAIVSIPILQTLITTFAAFSVCEGVRGFAEIKEQDMAHGTKVGTVWHANNCLGLSLSNLKCDCCLQFQKSLVARHHYLIRKNMAKKQWPPRFATSDPNDIKKNLPENDPLLLQIRIDELQQENKLLSKKIKDIESSVEINRSSKLGLGRLAQKRQNETRQTFKTIAKPVADKLLQSTNSKVIVVKNSSSLSEAIASMKPTSVVRLSSTSKKDQPINSNSIVDQNNQPACAASTSSSEVITL